MAIHGYHHIGLLVTDMEKSLGFYRDGLGGKVAMQFPMGGSGKTIYLVDIGGGAVVELLPTDSDHTTEPEANARFAHVCLATDDCRAAHALALQAGARERTAPQDISLGGLAVCNSFVLGPDGESLEFFQVKQG